MRRLFRICSSTDMSPEDWHDQDCHSNKEYPLIELTEEKIDDPWPVGTFKTLCCNSIVYPFKNELRELTVHEIIALKLDNEKILPDSSKV